MTDQKLEEERKHYYELGILEGRSQFNASHFITYFGAGLSFGILICLLIKIIN